MCTLSGSFVRRAIKKHLGVKVERTVMNYEYNYALRYTIKVLFFETRHASDLASIQIFDRLRGEYLDPYFRSIKVAKGIADSLEELEGLRLIEGIQLD